MSDEGWRCPKCDRRNSFWRANCIDCNHIYLPGTVAERLTALWQRFVTKARGC